MARQLHLLEDVQGRISSDLTPTTSFPLPNPNIEDRLEELIGLLSTGAESEKANALNILRINLTYPSIFNKLCSVDVLNICGNLIGENRSEEVFDAVISFLVSLIDLMSFDNDSTLRDSTLFPSLLTQSLPSDESLDGCLKIWEVWNHLSTHSKWPTSRFLFDDTTQHFVRTFIPFTTSKCVEEISPGALRVSQSFGLFEPLIQKIVTVAGNLGFNYSNNDAQFHSTTSFLYRLIGAESLETRLCVLQAVYLNLDGVRFKNPPLEWPVTETTSFSVNSDGTLKKETLLGKCSILLTESMKAIDTLLADLCNEDLKTLSNHCKLVTSAFSCLALLGAKNDEAKEILKSKGVMQQIGVWTGSLLETPLSPARTEAVLPIVEILVDVQSHSHSDDLISLDLVLPDSSTPLADLLTLVEPLLTINSNTAKTIIARFLRPCSKCCRPDSEDKSLLFAFFNKFVASEDFLRVDFEEYGFHDSILSFLFAHLFKEDSTNLTRIDTPSLHAYLPRILLSHGQTSPNLNGQVSWFVRVVTGLICQSLASLQFWKDVGGVAAIVHVLSLEECAESSHFALKAINENILFPYRSIPTPELRTLILRELEEEGLSDAVELIMNDYQNLPEWNS